MRNSVQLGLTLLVLTAIAVFAYNIYLREVTPPTRPYTEFLENLRSGEIADLHLRGGEITGTDRSGRRFGTYAPDIPSLLPLIEQQHIALTTEAPPDNEAGSLLRSLLPFVLILGGWLIFSRKQFNNALPTGNKSSRFKPVESDRVTFKDVAGISEALAELQEIVEFLKNPEKYSRLGGRIPRGVLLQGAPGTGKTLLAKAIAGEASVAFFSMSGSDFVEIFAGVGASRVRDLFTEAKKSAPCIIFIDEIDAIGGRRSMGQTNSANDEREQTLNALLVEMDGFGSGETVIMVAATNRPETLDPALLRPGRFDRQITIAPPDIKGRIKILEVHTAKITSVPGLDLGEIARSIPGFTGAEIANLVNEATLMAARAGKSAVDMQDFEEAKDRIILGLERKNIVISEHDRRVTAYHEAGHAIVGLLLEESDPLHKITIIPRGQAMGLTQQMPLGDRYTYSREYLLGRITTLMGGRVAEQLVFHRLTTGASNDLVAATEIATRIVCEWGMNNTMGPIAYQQNSEGFLGQSLNRRPLSEMTARQIDTEIKTVIESCVDQALDILKKHNKFLHKFAEALLINETMDAEEVDIVYRSYLKERELERLLKENRGNSNSNHNPSSMNGNHEQTEDFHEK